MWTKRLRMIARRVFHKASVEQELHEELRAYVDRSIDEHLARGLPADEARRVALAEFGGIEQVKERVREGRTAWWVDSVLSDISYASRRLMHRPSFTVLAVLTMALGIGSAAATFSMLDVVVLRPLPFRQADKLVSIETRIPRFASDSAFSFAADDDFGLSFSQYEALRKFDRLFYRIGAISRRRATLLARGEPRNVHIAYASASFFTTLGLQPVRGRLFLPEDEQADAALPVVVSHPFWMGVLGGNPDVLGQAIKLEQNGPVTDHNVIGILPPGFEFARNNFGDFDLTPDLWLPVGPAAFGIDRTAAGDSGFEVVAMLSDGISASEAQATIGSVIADTAPPFITTTLGKELTQVVRLQDTRIKGARTPLFVFFGAAGLLLVIACGNVGNLLLAEAAVRGHEIAMRAALGASRVRVVRQLITESIFLSLPGGAGGAMLAYWMIPVLVRLAPENLPRAADIHLDVRVLFFVTGISIISGGLFGLVPALTLVRQTPNVTLKETTRNQQGRHGRLQGFIIVGELALSFVLVVAAGLIAQSLFRLMKTDPGFRTENLLSVTIRLPEERYDTAARLKTFYAHGLESLRGLPGVAGVSLIDEPPFGGGSASDVEIEGIVQSKQEPKPLLYHRSILPNYFALVAAPIVAGRAFTDAEGADNAKVVIVNRAMARRFWPGQDPLNKRLKPGTPDWFSVVGVVEDLKEVRLGMEVAPTLYMPQSYAQKASFILRTKRHPLDLSPSIRERIWAIDRNLPIEQIDTIDNYIARSTADDRYRTILISLFAAAAISLALVGLFGVISRMVAFRTRELGVRMALGATSSNLIGLILRKSVSLTFAGVFLGLIGAVAGSRILSSFLSQISPLDLMTYLSTVAIFFVVSLLASYIAARRVARIDPNNCLRLE
jgi:predicted permease